MPSDDSSSNYDRSSRIEEDSQVHAVVVITDPKPDQPVITEADHHIGDLCGSAVALDLTQSRLHLSKNLKFDSAKRIQEDLKAQLTACEWENEFYSVFRDIYENLLAAIVDIANDLDAQVIQTLEYYLNPIAEGDEFLPKAVEKLDHALRKSTADEATAKQIWAKQWRPQRPSQLFAPSI